MAVGSAPPHVVCILAERSYFHGAAALSNSLVRNGFTGHIVVGYRGALPRWSGPVQPAVGLPQAITPGADIQFVEWLGDWHLSNQKPHFLLHVAGALYPEFASLWYFDCDIVIKTAWEHFARWTRDAMVLVLDLAETFMPDNHIFRREWQALATAAGLGHRAVSGYFNGGCLGLPSGEVEFLRIWARLMQGLADLGYDMSALKSLTGRPEFAKMDQDVMNAAVMAADTPFNVLGIEAMDAFPSANIMSHAMVFSKPWQRDYIHDGLLGYQPDPAHLAYWTYADGPIRSFTPAEWRRKRAILKLTRLMGYIKRSSVGPW